MRVLRQHLRDVIRARRGGWLAPSLRETREWLKAVDNTSPDRTLLPIMDRSI